MINYLTSDLIDWNEFVPVFDDEGGESGDGGKGEDGSGGEPKPQPKGEPKGDPKTPSKEGGDTKPKVKSFTQEEVDNMLSSERNKYATELEELRNNTNLTAEEKTKLEQRVSELRDEVKAKEKLTSQEIKRIREEFQEELESSTKERDSWKNRFHELKIQRDILDQVATDAYSPRQIVNLLRPQSELTPILDEDGNETGDFETRVKLEVDGKPASLRVPEAVKIMKDDVENYGNLFKSNIKSGLGGGSNKDPQTMKPEDFDGMSVEEYQKYRKQIRGDK